MKILLATDGSEHSEGAAKFLTCLNLASNDEITIFHAIYWAPSMHPSHVWFSQKWCDKEYDKESYYDSLKEIKKEMAPRIIDSAFRILQPVKANISTAIIEGCSPEECIINAAVDSDMDMIVMGASGVKGIESLFVGSVTRSVAIKSRKPVLVTKLHVCEKPDKMKILFATDGSEYSMATGEFLYKMPFPDNTEITVLNVIPSEFLDIPKTLAAEINERIAEALSKERSHAVSASEWIIDEAAAFLSKRFKDINILSKVGDAASEILETAETLKTDLIALGCRGLRGIRGIMGSVSRNILTHSECAVLIGKACKY